MLLEYTLKGRLAPPLFFKETRTKNQKYDIR